MELSEARVIPASSEKRVLTGCEEFILQTNGGVQIKTGPPVEEILAVRVPDGKQWDVTITVSVDETDS